MCDTRQCDKETEGAVSTSPSQHSRHLDNAPRGVSEEGPKWRLADWSTVATVRSVARRRLADKDRGLPFSPELVPLLSHELVRDRDDEVQRMILGQSPSNAYRLDFLRALFPNAEITVLHLVREPAASVTGLMSGWLHHGFHKHRLPDGALDIEGYTRPDQTVAWWKFDLPPHWQHYMHRPLEEVCAFQWISANEHILRWVERNRSDIHYAQIDTQRLTADLNGEIARLFAELELEPDAGLKRALALNRRTMMSYGVSDDSRIKLRRLATRATASPRVRDVIAACADAGNGPALEIAQTEASA
jgi:hypothetical protein